MDIDQSTARQPRDPRGAARAAVDAIEAKLDRQYPDRSVPDQERSESVENDQPEKVTETSNPEPAD